VAEQLEKLWEIDEKLVEISRNLYKKGVDISSETGEFSRSGKHMVSEAEVCYITGVLWGHSLLDRMEDRVAEKMQRGYEEGKITAEDIGKALEVFTGARKTYVDLATRKLEEKCGCKFARW